MSSIKISLNDDVRRVKADLTQANCYETILPQLKSAFGLPLDSKVTLKYHDDEDELITLSSSAELAEAARVSVEAGRKNLKLFAFVAGSGSDDVKSDTDSFIDVLAKSSPSIEEPLSAPAPAPVPVVDSVAVSDVVIEDCPVDETDQPLVSEEKVAPQPEAPVAPSPPAPASTNSLDELDLEEVTQQAIAFLLVPEAPQVVSAFVTGVFPALRAGELSVSDAIDKLLVALEKAGPALREHPLIQLVLPHRAALIPLAERGLQLIRDLGIDVSLFAESPLAFLPLVGCGAGGFPFSLFEQAAQAPEPGKPTTSADGKPVHSTVRCDGCDTFPIVGARFKCTRCPDFDLCEGCEAKGTHPVDHVLLKINRPPSNVDEQGRAIHRDVTCDGCNQTPLVGARFKCTVCPNYDLCQDCEKSGKHSAEHPLLKIREPVQHRGPHHHGHHRGGPRGFGRFCPRRTMPGGFPGFLNGLFNPSNPSAPGFPFAGMGRRCGGARAPHCRVPTPSADGKAQMSFVKDFTIPNKSHCLPTVTLKKTWLLRNDGAQSWPEGVKLVFESGTITPSSPLSTDVPQAQAGETVPVSIDIVTPSSPGHHFGYYHLATADSQAFGERFFVEIVVVEAQPAAPAPLIAPIIALSEDERKSKDQQSGSALPRPVTPPQATPVPEVALPAPVASPAPVVVASPSPAQPAPVAAPVPVPVAPRFQYEAELQLLTGMGFGDDSAKKALIVTKGDVAVALERLLA